MPRYDYDLAVLGGGAAGLTAAGIAANAGVKTLLVERHRLGGDCTWTGCVPSKTLLHHAERVHTARGLGADVAVDFPAVMAHVRALREAVYDEADAPEIYEGFGADVLHGAARFTDPHTVAVETGGETRSITARRFILCTGGRPAVPSIPGLDDVSHLTSDTLFEIEQQPRHLVIVGAGPIGMEMAQAFCRLGSGVTVLDRGDRPLGRDDAEHAAILLEALRAEGVRFLPNISIQRVAQAGSGLAVFAEREAEPLVEGDALLLATGRRPNVEGLGLDAAGVAWTERGITVNERCRTSQKHIFAAGDCTGEYQLTHLSEHMAKVATTNAVLRLPMTLDRGHVPWVTYTSPEVAQLGPTEADLREQGERFEVYRFPYTKVDRAVTDGATTGQIKVLATKWRGTILGASVVGARGGELIGLFGVAMRNGVRLREIADTILPYPTYALGARRAADQWYVRKQYPQAVALLQKVFGYRGTLPPAPDPDRIL